jgi:hypothetical protein
VLESIQKGAFKLRIKVVGQQWKIVKILLKIAWVLQNETSGKVSSKL